jgi:hypothetical protein
MSVRENIELYGLQDEAQIMDVLVDELGAVEHPNQENAYILGNQPFYTPRFAENHISILSFNNTPLPDSLVEALVDHPEVFPDDILVRWTQEQDLIFEATLGELRGRTTSS